MSLYSKTPTLAVNDPRGLLIRAVGYWRTPAFPVARPLVNRTLFDAAGRAVKQWDPRMWAQQITAAEPSAPASLATIYSLTGQVLRSDSVDAGTQVALLGLGAEALLGWDSRETRRQVQHDALLRPLAVFEEGISEPQRCVERFIYGQPGAGDPAHNQLGQLIRHDDPAGTVLLESFAIGGQNSENTRHFTRELVTPDWPEPVDQRQRLLEPGEGAMSQWRFGPLGQMLEQVDARGHRQGRALTLDGRLRASDLQLKHQTETQALVSDIHYNADGQVTQEVAGNGVVTTLTYCPEDGRLQDRQAKKNGGELLQHLVYEYDPMGNVLSIEDKALPIRYFANQRIEPISRFAYDSLYQLSEATGWEAGAATQGPESLGRVDPAAVSNYRQSYHYDESGNLLELTHVGARNGRKLGVARYSNRALPWRQGVAPSEEEIAAAYDPRGNLRALEAGRSLAWDLRNQLQSVTPVERASATNDFEQYAYDGGGQRVRKTRSLQTNARSVIADVRYLPGLELRTDTGSAEQLQVIIVEGGLNSVRVLHWDSVPPSGANDHYRYSVTDHLGSTSLELGEDARIISQETFYPFGETAWSKDTEVSYKTVRYSGKELDATGLYYYGYRYYMPWLQRWVNPDPAGAIDGLNLYRMALNNPVTYNDLDGGETRKKQSNGLWEPVIATGADRDVPNARFIERGPPQFDVPATGAPTSLEAALSIPQFNQMEVSASSINPQRGGYSPAMISTLRSGGVLEFVMDRLTSRSGAFNALRVVDSARIDASDLERLVTGYWAPQGGYVDIPARPGTDDPAYVFTPGFSGCSLTVEQLDDNTLRVRHVEGSKEDAQFNSLPSEEHGMGLSAAMEYKDYGFHVDESGGAEEVKFGFAYMKFSKEQQIWNIHYQTVQGASNVQSYSPGRSGWFNSSNASVAIHKNSRVRKTMTKRVTVVSSSEKF